METANPQRYQEIEYTETIPEMKQTESIDDSQDQQNTERNSGGPEQLKEGAKDKIGNYDQAAGDDGDTERRHFSSLPGNQAYNSNTKALGQMDTSQTSFNMGSSTRALQVRGIEEEEKKEVGQYRSDGPVE